MTKSPMSLWVVAGIALLLVVCALWYGGHWYFGTQNPTDKKLSDEYSIIGSRVYFINLMLPDADPATFTLFKDSPIYAKDAGHVYSEYTIVSGADLATFSPFKDSHYAKDASHIYFEHNVVNDADIQTFVVRDWNTTSLNDFDHPTYDAEDANHYYLQGKIVTPKQ